MTNGKPEQNQLQNMILNNNEPHLANGLQESSSGRGFSQQPELLQYNVQHNMMIQQQQQQQQQQLPPPYRSELSSNFQQPSRNTLIQLAEVASCSRSSLEPVDLAINQSGVWSMPQQLPGANVGYQQQQQSCESIEYQPQSSETVEYQQQQQPGEAVKYQEDGTPATLHIRTNIDPYLSVQNTLVTQQQRPWQNHPNNIALNDASGDGSNNEISNTSTTPFNNFRSAMIEQDDELMKDAKNNIEPNLILPITMMGGTPTGGSFFTGGTTRANHKRVRSRHRSEGSWRTGAGSQQLKQHLNQQQCGVEIERRNVGVANKRYTVFNSSPHISPYLQQSSNQPAQQLSNSNNPVVSATNNSVVVIAQNNNRTMVQQQEQQVQASITNIKENWAEPKPVAVRRPARQRRHSADCRLTMNKHKYHQYGNMRTTKRNFASIGHHEARKRSKPPPLVIPQSVNTLSPMNNTLYQSNLHRK